MKRLNNKGFTLIELIATIVLLSIVVAIGGYAITNVISKSKEKDYQLLVKEIKNAIEVYYQECNYVNDDCDNTITLGYLVTNGYLKGNSANGENTLSLVNPNDSENISNCEIKYVYSDGNITVEDVTQSGSCPKTDDYN